MGARYSPLALSLLALLALLFVVLYVVAYHLGVDMFDTFEIFLNARRFAGLGGDFYSDKRAFVMPLLLAPVFRLASSVSSDEASLGLQLSHLVSVTLVGVLLWASYRVFRRDLDRLTALAGTTLLALNRLVIHAAPISKEDLPGAMMVTLAFLYYLRAHDTGRRKHVALAVLFLTLTMGTRYNVIPLMPLVIAAYELRTRGRSLKLPQIARLGALYVALPAALWLLIPTLIYVALGRASFFGAPAKFIGELAGATSGAVGSEMGYPEYPWENVGFLVRSYTFPIFLAALWGMRLAWRQRKGDKLRGGLFHGLWLGVFLAFHSFALGHKEARYLFPLFPPLYYFAARGARELILRAREPRARAAMAAALAALPLYLAGAELWKFTDPFYTENFARDISRYAGELAQGHVVRWFGTFYAIHPRDFVFDPEDEVTYLYHYYAHTFWYYARTPIQIYPRKIKTAPGASLSEGFFLDPQASTTFEDGEVAIINREPNPYVTKSVPAALQPMVVERARVARFNPMPSRDRAGSPLNAMFRSEQLAGTRLVTRLENGRLLYRFSDLPPGLYMAIMDLPEARHAGLGLMRSVTGRIEFDYAAENLPSGLYPTGYRLIHFDSVKLFTVPGMPQR